MSRIYLVLILIVLSSSIGAVEPLSGAVEIKGKQGLYTLNWRCSVSAQSIVSLTIESTSLKGKSSLGKESVSADIVLAESCEDLLIEQDDIDGDTFMDIAVNTTSTDMRKSRSIFLFDPSVENFVYAGLLPVSAEFIAPFKYQLIDSDGGSLFETLLKIEEKKIRAYPQKELVLDGEVCVSKNKHVVFFDEKCLATTLHASTKKPICIEHGDVKPRIVSRAMCKRLLSQIQQ